MRDNHINMVMMAMMAIITMATMVVMGLMMVVVVPSLLIGQSKSQVSRTGKGELHITRTDLACCKDSFMPKG